MPGIEDPARQRPRRDDAADADLPTLLAVQNAVPIIGLKIHVEETLPIAGKAPASKSQLPAAQVERNSFPTLGRIIAEQTAAVEVEAEKVMEEAYRTRLY